MLALVTLLLVLPPASAATGAPMDEHADTPHGDTEDAVVAWEDGDVAGAAGDPLLRARPGVPLVAFAAGGDAIYVVDARGDVRASLDGGRTFRVGRFPARRSLVPLVRSLPAAAGARGAEALGDIDPFVLQQSFGYVGDNVWLDISSTFFLKSGAGNLFAFPYGTTGEAYLEFTPDSPAFWDAQWVNGIPRSDIQYAKTTLSSHMLDDANAVEAPDESIDEAADVEARVPTPFTLTIDAGDARVAFLTGPFGAERTADGGATWFPAEDDVGADAMPLATQLDAFVVTADALSRVRPAEAAGNGPDDIQLAALRRMRARGPSLDEVMLGARRSLAQEVDDSGGRAPFVPRIDLLAGYFLADSRAVLDAVFLDATFVGDAQFVRQTAEVSTDNGKDAAFARSAPMVNPFVAVLLSWDLPSLFTPASSPAQRRGAQAAWTDLERDVIDALHARERVLEDLAFRPPSDDDDLMVLALDLFEAEARITALSGARFAPLDGRAAQALARLPATEPVASVVEHAQRHLGVGDDRLTGFARAQRWRPAMPTLVAAGSYIDTSLDELDFLDEIGTSSPWVKKSANGHIVQVQGRLTWDLPHTLRARDDVADLARVRRDVALDATGAYFERRRTQAFVLRAPHNRDDALVVDELTAVLSGMTGGWFADAQNNRSPR